MIGVASESDAPLGHRLGRAGAGERDKVREGTRGGRRLSGLERLVNCALHAPPGAGAGPIRRDGGYPTRDPLARQVVELHRVGAQSGA